MIAPMATFEPLSTVIAARGLTGDHLRTPFLATHYGAKVSVRAVLERTAVVVRAGGDVRTLVRQTELLVDPWQLEWREPHAAAFPRRGWRLAISPRPRRCTDCRRTAAEVRFPSERAARCLGCERLRRHPGLAKPDSSGTLPALPARRSQAPPPRGLPVGVLDNDVVDECQPHRCELGDRAHDHCVCGLPMDTGAHRCQLCTAELAAAAARSPSTGPATDPWAWDGRSYPSRRLRPVPGPDPGCYEDLLLAMLAPAVWAARRRLRARRGAA